MSFLPDNPNFADIIDDDIICNSQPISLPSENSDKEELNFNDHNPAKLRPPKRTGQQGEFRSTEEIDPKYRHIFTYPYFNLVQSRVIEDALYTDKSMVVCAPTGSGKTVVFEMAIAQLLMDIEDRNYTGDFKIIYMAPVKALCTERLTEWYPKLTKLGLLCIEVTGDTDVEYPQLKPYSVIITTPEKWDMLTRRWRDHKGLVEVVKLFLIDEVHILNDNVRGPVLEAVVSRMKTIESSVQSAHRIEHLQRQYENNQQNKDETTPGPRIRFVAVSATVNNPEDVAAWLGTSEKPAVFYKFGDECRPVKLKRVVEGYPCPEGTSIFKFDIILNYKLWPIIQKYHNGKPTLIFCNTRKSVALTAEALSREITITFNPEQKAKLAALASTIKNKKLQTLILNGVGCHHAGLLFEERMNIEYAFRNRDLPILITTTTLAMGVNLPAHLVIIKNTQQYVNGAYQEYSISTILQMVGRAGRPQFDTEATAVIMTRMADKARYQALVGGTEPLQSFLHKRLAENLNSEAALGTITDVAQCVQWLNSTFLSVRAAKDPKRYLGLPPSAPTNQISKKIEELCVIAINGLASSGLITMDEASCIESTEAGKLMSVYYIDLETMKLIMKIEGSESLERLLWLVCECHELSDMHLRVDERRCLNALNRNNTAATIRFPMKGKINSRQMKLNCVIQAVLGCLPIPDPSLNQEAMKIMRIADRVCKCLVAYTTRPSSIHQQSRTFSAVLNAIILAKCIAVHLWENSPYVSKQLRGIGPIFSMLLASAGKVNFMLLEESHPRDLERIMNKGPPAGNMIRKQISLLPKYQITISLIDGTRAQVQVSLLNQAHLLENIEHLTAGANHKSYIIVGDSENCLLYLNSFKDTDLIRVYDGCITCEVTRKHNHEHKIMAYCISSSFVGIDVQSDYLFMDLEPTYNLRADYVPNMCDNVSKAVTNINFPDSSKSTDRKRKIIDTGEVTCSKEKIKRENNLLEKFKYLKESFGKTSTALMGNFNKTTEMSNKIMQNLTASKSKNDVGKRTKFALTKDISDLEPAKEQHTAPIDYQSVMTSTVHNLSPIEDLFENLEDDDKVNNILQEIEDEIGKNVEQRKVLHTNLCSTLPITCQSNNNKKNKAEKQHKKIKSNFNFINKLESEDNVFEDNINDDVGGFAETVKVQIDKYLQNAVKVKPPVINYEEFLNTKYKDYADVQINGTDNNLLNTIENTNETSVTEKKCYPLHEQLGIGQNFKTNQKEDENKDDCEQINLSEQQNDHPINFIGDIESSTRILSKLKSPCLQKDTVQNTYPDLSKMEISQQSKQVISKRAEYNINDNNKHDINQNEINNNFSSQKINSLCNHKQKIKNETFRDGNIGINSSRLTELSIPITYNHDSTIMSEDVHIFSNPQNTNIADLTQEKTSRIENYSFRATKFVMSQQRNIKQTIQIIKKLKIGLDVTKIISTNEDTGKDNSNVPFINTNKPGFPEESVINEIDSIDFDIQLEPEFNKILDVIDNVQLHNNRGNNNIEAETESKNQDDPSPLLQKKSDVQTTPKINTTRTPEPEDNLPNLSKCSNVKDLIRKYSLIMERRKTPSTPVTKPVFLKNVTKPHVQQPVEKPKRRYKINEIQNLEIDFPKMPIADSRELDPNEQEILITKREDTDDIYCNSRISENFKDIPEYQIHVCNEPTQTNICNEMKTDLEFNLETHSPQIKGVFQPEFTHETCNINNNLLNPKILLQCFDNKTAFVDDEVIPPPPEYADVLAVSPTQSKTNVTNAYTPASPVYYSEMENYDLINRNPDYTEPVKNIFDDYNEDVCLTTPTGTIETWTLSHEVGIPEYKTHPIRSFTVMKNNSINKLSPYDARNMKLNEFKLVKNLPKLKKN